MRWILMVWATTALAQTDPMKAAIEWIALVLLSANRGKQRPLY